tara:strand:- start:878 stop:1252 length:375 start_codon:yes stop_codon:yes gene_type:complete
MDIIYEQLLLKTNTSVYDKINIKKIKEDKLGIQYSLKPTEITDDKRLVFPEIMIFYIIPNSIAEKYNIRLGSQIVSINDIDVSFDNYQYLIKNENLSIKVNTSFCMIYQLLLREGVKFNFLNLN